MKDFIEKFKNDWEKTGLLETCENKPELSKILDKLYEITMEKNTYSEQYIMIIFPVFVRIYNSLEKKSSFNIEEILDKFNESFFDIDWENLYEPYNIDYEAEFCCSFCEEIVRTKNV